MLAVSKQVISWVALLVVSAVVTNVSSLSDSASGIDSACAEIATAYARWIANHGEGTFSGIPGQTGHDCLRSMPFRQDLAVSFVDEYIGYLQFHSTIEILKSPPPDYISTSVDLIGGLEMIRRRAVRRYYTSQYDFDWDLNYLISRANDGHLKVGLCSLEVFHFEHGVPLVSVSEDGLQIPELYTFFDAELKANGVEDVSPVVEINGVDAVYYLEANVAVTLSFQDPDARYNRVFTSAVDGFSSRYGGGDWTTYLGLWPGASHQVLQFANGSNFTVETTASWPSLNGQMDYRDGEALFQAACTPNGRTRFGSPSKPLRSVPAYSLPPSGPARYPTPVLRHPEDLIRGYYLNETGTHDVAVLQVPTFELGTDIPGFVKTAISFVKRAVLDGKVKMIIDLSGNSGGDVAQGFNLFRVFYPDRPIYSATRFRATELIDLMGQVFARAIDIKTGGVSDSPFAFEDAVTPDQQDSFASWEQLYGPHKILGAKMSSLYAVYNLSTASSRDVPISGYGVISSDFLTQSFETENIVVMTDGTCASTCSMFAELMKKQGVRSIAFGGRPQYGPMQALGGVKGGQYLSLPLLHRYISRAHDLAVNASEADSPILTPEQLARFEELAPPGPTNFSLRINRFGTGGVNFRNAYREGNNITPLQFVYEAADCRLFYTAENYIRPATSWRAAANAMLNGGSCVPRFQRRGPYLINGTGYPRDNEMI